MNLQSLIVAVTRTSANLNSLEKMKRIEAGVFGRTYSFGRWNIGGHSVEAVWSDQDGQTEGGSYVLQQDDSSSVSLFSGQRITQAGVSSAAVFRQAKEPEDSSSVLAEYETDSTFPARLNGRFYGLILDRERGRIIVFNDRYGMHRLHYRETEDATYFASDAKALLALCPETRELDPQGLGELIACGAVLENRTLFRGIHILPPGSMWIFENGRTASKRNYFTPGEWERQEPLESTSYYEALCETFAQILPRYFAGSKPIGMSLTGGLDTRMILACRRPAPGSLPCYTFGSMFHENQDVRVARRLAQVSGQSHQVLVAGQEFLQNFSSYAERAIHLTSGSVEVGRAPDLYLNELARQIAPVRMTGNYGGEILRSVRAFKPVMPAGSAFAQDVMYHVRQAEKTFSAVSYRHPVSFSAFQQAPWSLYGVLALEQTQIEMRSPFLDNDLVKLVYRAPASDLHANRASIRLVAAGYPDLLRIPTDRGASLDGGSGGGLQQRFLEFTFKAEYAYDMGMPQWLARIDRALKPLHLERRFLGRHKPFHFRFWYRSALAGYLRAMLLDERALSRAYVDRYGLQAAVLAHTNGRGNFTNELHKLLTLELVQRQLLD